MTSRRRIAFGGIDRTAEGDTDGYDLSARIGASYRIAQGVWEITPRADLRYARLYQNGYTETGAGAIGLTVDDQTVESVQSRIGTEVARTFTTEGGMSFRPALSLAWRHEFGDTDRTTNAAFSGLPGQTFQVAGAEADKDALELGAGLNVAMDKDTSWYVGYTADLSRNETSHGVMLGVRITW